MKKFSGIFPMAVVTASGVMFIFRIAQLLTVVDFETMGFFDSAAPYLLTNGIYLFFLLAAVIFGVGIFLDKKKGYDCYTCKASGLSPKFTLIMGISFIAGFCLQFFQLFFGSGLRGLALVGEIVTMAAYLAAAFMLLARKEIKPSIGYIQLVISVSYTVKAAALFMQDTIIVRVSDELILLLSYVMSVLFFLALGRFISGNETKTSRIKLLFTAGAVSVLSVCASLSGGIAYLIDMSYMGDHMANHPLSEIAAAAIALSVIFALYGEKKELTDENTEGNIEKNNVENNSQPEIPQNEAQ